MCYSFSLSRFEIMFFSDSLEFLPEWVFVLVALGGAWEPS
jgi:hypothetical protein